MCECTSLTMSKIYIYIYIYIYYIGICKCYFCVSKHEEILIWEIFLIYNQEDFGNKLELGSEGRGKVWHNSSVSGLMLNINGAAIRDQEDSKSSQFVQMIGRGRRADNGL